MKIGIYNRYWNTRGGGERYAGLMAEILAADHRVELLGPDPVDLQGLAAHLGLDFSRLRFRLLPPTEREDELTPLTAGYDLFINCTYLSRLRSQARRSLYLVLFPQRAWPRPLVHGVQRLLDPLSLERPALVEPGDGFYDRDASGSLWTRDVFTLRIHPRAVRQREVRVRFGPLRPWTLAEAIREVRGSGVRWRVEDRELVLDLAGTGNGAGVEVEVECRTFVPAEHGRSRDLRSLGLCLAGVHRRDPWALVQRAAGRVAGRVASHDPDIPATYDLLLAISEFTRRWVERRWGLRSEVLPPPVDVDTFAAPADDARQRVILSVGRFFHGSHNKKHVEMLRVFRRMCDRGEIPAGWEFRLVGNLHRDRLADLEYFSDVERLAAGYPVRLRVDLSLEELVDEYRRASIFWHAAGWGESERWCPEKLEHFGITTCEAMSSGCIPVVIAKAGQLEIVEDGETGFLFRDSRQLAAITRRLIEGHGEAWTDNLRRRAADAVRRFSRQPFERRLREVLNSHGLLPADVDERPQRGRRSGGGLACGR